ncbi:hypothetical protein MUG78_17115 [Gordonia alkaliphila]|uniref:hypothetical protein n=1 Tax=Gordonia alkaliphila TaxID=1053547 RepID=UPI001FF6D8CB|nr:hypothetical protein [Gordonia alkaliphila]MCK0441122.1 hypothetical protein [Gordonia alkaliphila]
MPYPTESIVYSVELEGQDDFDLTAYIVEDTDCDAEQRYDRQEFADLIRAWKNDEFQFVGVVVEASREGVTLGDASIWGSEYGDIEGKHVQPIGDDGSDNIGYLPGLIKDAIAAAYEKLSQISR